MAGATRPEFFRMLSPSSLLKLPIPPNFTKYLEKEKGRKASILSPVGKFWHVGLLQDKHSNMFLEDGWEKFARAHDLGEGNMVLFRYEGNMVFTVKIFQSNGCRADYTNAPRHNNLQDGQIMDPKYKSSVVNRVAGNTVKKKQQQQPDITCSNKKRKQAAETPKLSVSSSCLTRTKGIPQFEILVKAYSLAKGMIYVPAAVRSSNDFKLLRKKRVMTVKADTSGRQWSLCLWHGASDSAITRGWRQFAMDNNLEEGDKCIFQIVSEDVMHIQIQKKEEPKLVPEEIMHNIQIQTKQTQAGTDGRQPLN